MVGRPDYRLNAVLLRGITTSSLIACSCAIWINLGSCMHLNLDLLLNLKGFSAFSLKSEVPQVFQRLNRKPVVPFLYGGWIKTERVVFCFANLFWVSVVPAFESDEPHYGRSYFLKAVVFFQRACIFIVLKTLRSVEPEPVWRMYRSVSQRLFQCIKCV